MAWREGGGGVVADERQSWGERGSRWETGSSLIQDPCRLISRTRQMVADQGETGMKVERDCPKGN